tara:strand:+ start:334 stop:708 length:375 start_codon:yes stop_codon:yes gene_type:complete
MTKKCKIIIDKINFDISLLNTPTAEIIWKNLPISSSINIWGEEVYFYVDVDSPVESEAKSIIEFGEIAYWPSGKAIAIGFGRTPISKADEIQLADNCNIWAITKFDLKKLKQVKQGCEARIEKR